jgi:hypothetical protein
MRKVFLVVIFLPCWCAAQVGSFAPQVGEFGSTAIHKDDDRFRDWAISCQVIRGLQQIDLADSGYASSGSELYATGKADAPLTLSLGDGGQATLTFSGRIFDGIGPDFAVFENGFGSGVETFLEFAFVEVSSDGIHFFRFPAVSEIQDSIQKETFENTDASLVKNLAGKYTVNYGVPFDLADLPDTSALDKGNVSHVRIIDVVGVLDSNYATIDANGKKINDPWPTNFPQSGFDLDAVGIINSTIPVGIKELRSDLEKTERDFRCFDLSGRVIPCSSLNTGLYIQSGELKWNLTNDTKE